PQPVAPVGLEPIAKPPGRIRSSDHPALLTPFREQTVYPNPTRPRLVDKPQRIAQRLELAHRAYQRTLLPADATVMTDLAAFLSERDVDRLFVHVHTDK